MLLLLALAPLAGLWAFWVVSRFLAFVIPIGLLWAAVGLDHLLTWLREQIASIPAPRWSWARWALAVGRSAAARALPLAIMAAALLATDAEVIRREMAQQPFWRQEIAQWLVEHVPAGSRIMTRNSEVALYAGLPQVAFPNAEWPQVRAYGQARGAAYLVVEDREIQEIRPQHSILLESSDPHPLPGLTLIARLPGPGRTTLVYAFDEAP